MPGSHSLRGRALRERTRDACAATTVTTIALAVAGCGDSDNDKRTATTTSSGLRRAVLVQRADAICRPHFDRITAAAQDVAAEYRTWLDDSDATLAKIKKSPPLITSAANFKTVNTQATKLGLGKPCHVGPS